MSVNFMSRLLRAGVHIVFIIAMSFGPDATASQPQGSCSPDIDSSHTVDASTDGLLVMRYMFGFRGETLIAGALHEDALIKTADGINAIFEQSGCQYYLDVDGNGVIDALSDGLLFVRWASGFTGESLILDAIGSGATRTTAVSVIEHLNGAALMSTAMAHRFLTGTTFGPTPELIDDLMSSGYEAWTDAQLNAPSAYDEPYTEADPNHLTYLERYMQIARMIDPEYYGWNSTTIEEYTVPRLNPGDIVPVFTKGPKIFPSVWFEHVLHAPDQLRQRVAYALSQILVVDGAAQGATSYYDLLAKHAFGNYRDLLIDVSFSSEMCYKLTFSGSRGDRTDIQPDENYARELMQLFTIGLHRMNLDGTPMLDAGDKLIPNYTDADIEAISRVFTGWDRHRKDGSCGGYVGTSTDTYRPICQVKNGNRHDYDEKIITLNNSGYGTTIPQDLTPHADTIAVIDMLMGHPNMAPFISRHLIMRLVKSNPTPAYLARVAGVFADNGSGVKGDLKAVVRAILLDEEALALDPLVAQKAKEPILSFTQFLRAFEVSFIPGYERYRFRSDFQGKLGQGPLTSPTVFNFYDNSFVPNHEEFRSGGMVSPEIQIIDEQGITLMANQIFEAVTKFEINSHTALNGGRPKDRYALSFEEEFAILNNSIDHDYSNLASAAYREKAADALIPYLDNKLTGGNLSTDQVQPIKDYVVGIPLRGSEKSARNVIASIIRLIVATDAFVIQK